jgi:transposase-like protein
MSEEKEPEKHHNYRHRRASRHDSSSRRCPRCSSTEVRRARSRGAFELWVLPVILHRPYHCHRCLRHFYAFRFSKKTFLRASLTLAVAGISAGLILVIIRVLGTLF